ncbi:hypothetical protein J2X63_001767 [Agromyces sp. 3263]|uniref:hypothetical protein n=1 Tax=Agromyces sp. 3263 TaxID=2817750 RepID=UPI0028559C86|nr:hypothetical protein [Agromyces sp. 3263]MDR6906081.1 hypothetical protein [Agromyces sp. 3263]
MSTQAKSRSAWKITSIMLAFAGTMMFLFGAIAQYWYNVRNPTIACSDLQNSTAPAEALRHSSVTWWPVGIRCEYASGPEQIMFQSDWTLTLVMLLGTALVLVAIAMWRASARHPRLGEA